MTLLPDDENEQLPAAGVDDGEATSRRWRRFWERQFADLEASIFPRKPSAADCGPRNVLHHEITDLCDSRLGQSLESIVRAAWSIVQARYTGLTDVVFGATVFHEQSVNVVPVRVRVTWEQTVEELLGQVELQMTEMDAFVQDDRSRIAELNPEALQACSFQTVLDVDCSSCPDGFARCSNDVKTGDSASGRTKWRPVRAEEIEALLVTVRAVKSNLQIKLCYNSSVLEESEAQRLMGQLENVLRQVASPQHRDLALGSVQTASQADVRDMWAWNPSVPHPPAICVHDVLHTAIPLSRNSPAVEAWDGKLTYGELDKLSGALAQHILKRSLPPGSIVCLIFNKTMWCTVAMLAVMKAGMTTALLPASHPEPRLRQMIQQVDAKLVLTSESARAKAERLTELPTLMVNSDSIRSLCEQPDVERPCLPKVDPASPLCILFTSGSTGTPKAAVLSHKNMVAALLYQKDAHQLSQSARYLDLAPQHGDAVWMNNLLPLSHGACLCVASDSQRLGTDMLSLSKFKATYALVAPTMADLLFELNLPDLKTVVLGGEPFVSAQIVKWRTRGTQVLNCYGPAECTPFIALNDVSDYTGSTISIGRPIACCAWIAEPETGDSLVGIGMIGELWLESPLVGDGYLNDELRTEAAFVSDPPWLLRGTSGCNGRRGRLYKTGDLVKYNHDGTLVVIGRKGTMSTIRGQRFEPGDVEHHLKKELGASGALQVAVEIIVPPGRARQRLAGFVDARLLDYYVTDISAATLQAKIEHLRGKLADVLPAYMVPTDILAVEAIPLTATTKIDRRALRKKGESTLAVRGQ